MVGTSGTTLVRPYESNHEEVQMTTVLDPALVDNDAEGALHPGALRSELPQIVAGYRKMKAFDKMTGDFKGWLGSTGNMNLYLYDLEDDSHVAWVRFADFKDQKWLARDTTPNDRFLGLATQGYATWGLTGGWNNPIIWHPDHTISLDPKHDASLRNRFLYLYKGYCCFSDDGSNSNILRFEFA